MTSNTPSSRNAYTCIPENMTSTTGDYNIELAAKYCIARDAIITLTPEEQRLFRTFEDAATAFEHQNPPFDSPQKLTDMNLSISPSTLNKPIEVRIAGGWVRDKIMNQPSHDVDIALDAMSGHQFAIIIQQYLLYKEYTNPNGKKPKIAVIAANPSQSKHLETATMSVYGIDCDFVHLRGGEVYTEHSRIPTLKEDATPLDDALRRDFTVNALFYNMRSQHVEDWTGRGIQDLIKDKLLVTPLDAKITFHDDPLRVLRAIRFAVRYNLTLSDEIQAAARSQEVHESLHAKVSRERVGKELEGMLSGKNARPCTALRMMTDLKLAGCVFEFPHVDLGKAAMTVRGSLHGLEYDKDGVTEEDRKHARELAWLEATGLLQFCAPALQFFDDAGVSSKSSSTLPPDATKLDKRILYLGVFLHPLRNMICTDAKGKEISLPTFIVRDSIKYPNKDTTSVATLLRHIDEFRSMMASFDVDAASTFSRLKVGLMLRDLKDLWVTALIVAAIVEMHTLQKQNMESASTPDIQKLVSNKMTHANHFFQAIHAHNLDKCWKLRPLLDGKAILKSLNLPRGPIIGEYLQEQVRWMLLNPNGAKEECELHLKEVRKRKLSEAESNGGGSD